MSKSRARLSPTKLFAHDEFMDRARKEKRVTRTEISMKHLKPDTSLQARVNTLDTEHVRKLHGILKDGLELAPIVVFEIGEHKYKIADGFHRYEAVRREGRLAITCDVIKGTLQEAIEYAASCNREMCLPRQPEDIKKAIYMLLANGWLKKSLSMIASQVGCGKGAVARHRLAYCGENAIEPPDEIVALDGSVRRHHRKPGDPLRMVASQIGKNGRIYYKSRVNGKYVSLGSDKEKAAKKLADLEAGLLPTSVKINSNSSHELLVSRNVLTLPVSGEEDTAFQNTQVRRTRVAVFSFWVVDGTNGSPAVLTKAVGEVLLAAVHFGLSRKVIIKQHAGQGHHGLVAAAEKLGVEFMTLDEFVASEKDAAQ